MLRTIKTFYSLCCIHQLGNFRTKLMSRRRGHIGQQHSHCKSMTQKLKIYPRRTPGKTSKGHYRGREIQQHSPRKTLVLPQHMCLYCSWRMQ
jgi:hypothetical protein